VHFNNNTSVLKGSFNKPWGPRLARALIVAAVCLLGTPLAMADTWDDVVAAHLAGDDVTALRLALPLARNGEARAQGLVGFLYMFGRGVEWDRDQAMNWYRLASEQGDAGAQANLCTALSSGNPAEFHLDEAAYWCRLSAAQGYDGGLFNLGRLYYLGLGVERNMLEAYVWLSFAELRARHPNLRNQAANLKAQAIKYLTVSEIAEADRRISAWKSGWQSNQP
jgi:hypothetical protein